MQNSGEGEEAGGQRSRRNPSQRNKLLTILLPSRSISKKTPQKGSNKRCIRQQKRREKHLKVHTRAKFSSSARRNSKKFTITCSAHFSEHPIPLKFSLLQSSKTTVDRSHAGSTMKQRVQENVEMYTCKPYVSS